MQNAFDDLNDQTEHEYDDDEYSIKYPTNPTNTGFNDLNANLKPRTNNDHDAAVEVLHMKNVLASKNEEIRNMTAEFNSERMKLQSEMEELKKRYKIVESEKDRTNMNRKQEHELFVESKQKLSEREEKILELNARIKSLDASKMDVVAELERTKILLSDTQQKFHMVQKDMTSEKHMDSVIKQINDRHAAQVDMMQQQINTMRTKLEDRESELKRLIIQNNELHKSREAFLLDKSDTINQLTKRLDESQRQCQELVMKQGGGEDFSQENIRLMRKNTQLEQQIEELQKTINNLTTR